MKGKTQIIYLISIFLSIIILLSILAIFTNNQSSYNQITSNDTTNNITDNKSILYHFSDAYKPFTGADYYVDPVSEIVLTAQKEERRNGYDLDVRGFSPTYNWTSEFFCEPDTVVIAYNNSTYMKAYLDYLVWIDDVYLSDDQVMISLLHLKEFGNLGPLINPVALKSVDDLPIDIEETHNHFLGSNLIDTNVTICNRGDSNLNIIYVYQDAAYLWYPRGNQSGVTPVFYSSVSGVNNNEIGNYTAYSLKSNDKAFAGYADKEHDVISGIISASPDTKVGIIPEYIGLVYGSSQSIPGFEVLSDQKITYTDIPDEKFNGSAASDNDFKAIYIAFNLENMAPGETRSFNFYRFAYNGKGEPLSNDTLISIISSEMANQIP